MWSVLYENYYYENKAKGGWRKVQNLKSEDICTLMIYLMLVFMCHKYCNVTTRKVQSCDFLVIRFIFRLSILDFVSSELFFFLFVSFLGVFIRFWVSFVILCLFLLCPCAKNVRSRLTTLKLLDIRWRRYKYYSGFTESVHLRVQVQWHLPIRNNSNKKCAQRTYL